MFNWIFKKVVTFREKVAVDLNDGDTEKPFLEHLDDLRSMIVRMVVTLLVVTVVTFVFIKDLIAIITFPLTMAGIADKVVLQNLKVTGGFMTAMNISIVAGVILAFPLLLYFLLQFVLPGLRTTEKKVLFPALGVGAGLFMVGVLFAYFLVAPRALEFFYEFSHEIGNTAAPKKEEVQKVAEAGKPDAATTTATDPKAPPPVSVPGLDPAQVVKTEVTADGRTIVYYRCCKECTCGVPATLSGVAPVPAPAPDSGVVPAPAPAPSSVATPAPAVAAPVAVVAAAPAPFIWELTDYVKFMCQFILIFGACFELPVVVMALVKLDVLNYKVMATSRGWAAILIAVFAAVITPTQDALTLALLAVPMYLLYEICIWLAWWLEKRDRALYPEYYKDQDNDAKALEVSDDWDNENYNPWGGGDDEDEGDDEGGNKASPKPKPAAPAPASTPDATSQTSSSETGGDAPASDTPNTSSVVDSASTATPEAPDEVEEKPSLDPEPAKDDPNNEALADKYSDDEDDWSTSASGQPPKKEDKKSGDKKPGTDAADDEPTADKRDTD